MNVPFVLDRSPQVPIHRQIYDVWRAGILIAGTYGGAPVTVTAAYDQLLKAGGQWQ